MAAITQFLPQNVGLGIPANQLPAAMSSAKTILAEFTKAGLPTSIALAAVVNAYEESRLDPFATYGVTPWSRPPHLPSQTRFSEKSSGLFMLNPSPNAAGAGLSEAQRWDPTTHTRRIVSVVQGPSGGRLRAAAANGAPVSQLTALFTEDIERPANRMQKGQERAQTAARLFPGVAHVDSRTIPTIKLGILDMLPQVRGKKPLPTWALALAFGGLLLGAVLVFIRR